MLIFANPAPPEAKRSPGNPARPDNSGKPGRPGPRAAATSSSKGQSGAEHEP